MEQNAGNPPPRWSRCSARAEHRGPGRALANPEGKRGLQGQFQAGVGKPMIQSEILQTHTAWLLLSTPATAACSALLVLDTESSPTPRAHSQHRMTGQNCTSLCSRPQHILSSCSVVSVPTLCLCSSPAWVSCHLPGTPGPHPYP